MANYATLKAAIAAAIKQNGNHEITGALLQQQLLAMVNSLGVGYQYVGIATTDTNPGTPDQNVFYIAFEPGTYANFGGLTVNDGEIAILKYNGAWSKDSTGAVTMTEQQNGDVITKANILSLKNALQWKPGNIDPDSGEIIPSSSNNYYSSIFPAGLITDGITCDRYLYRQFSIAYYDDNNVFQRRDNYMVDKFDWNTIAPNQRIRIIVATKNISDNTLPVETVLDGIRFLSIDNERLLQATKIISSINSVSFKNPDLFRVGLITESGAFQVSNTNHAIVTRDFITEKTVIQLPDTLQFNICYYNNGVFAGRGGWVIGDGEQKIIDAEQYKLIIAAVEGYSLGDSYIVEDTLNDVTLFANSTFVELHEYAMFGKMLNVATFPYTTSNYKFTNIRSSDGAEIPPSSNVSNYASNMIDANMFSQIKITAIKEGYSACIAKWDGTTGEFVSRTDYAPTVEMVNNNQYSVRYVLYAPNTTDTLEEIIDGFNIEIVSDFSEPLTEYVDGRIKLAESKNEITYPLLAFFGKYMHFSVDDSLTIWLQLINNPSAQSIFDNGYFGALKEIHDATGMCVTINLFCCDAAVGGTPTKTLADIPNTWASEFQQNSDWLKFSLHSYFTDQKYGTPITGHSLLEDFTYCNAQIERFTGTKDCISRQIRLGYFNCPSEQEAISIVGQNMGPKIYSTADDGRESNMYLDTEQRNEINTKGLLYDKNNELIFVKSMPRLDDATNISSLVATSLQYKGMQKVMEMFCHEASYVTYKTQIINLFNLLKNTYKFQFAFLPELFNN